jgi:hypothetical protein
VCDDGDDTCSNQTIETLLNQKSEYRDYIQRIIRYGPGGEQPEHYDVFPTSKYQRIRTALKLDDSELLDDAIKPNFKILECGSSYTFVCYDIIDKLEGGLVIPNIAVNDNRVRISNCTVGTDVVLGLKSECHINQVGAITPIFPPTTPPTYCTDVAILMKTNPLSATEDWTSISTWDYISYANICNSVEVTPTPPPTHTITTPPSLTETITTPPSLTETITTPPPPTHTPTTSGEANIDTPPFILTQPNVYTIQPGHACVPSKVDMTSNHGGDFENICIRGNFQSAKNGT